jgi:hypothetical protein
MKKLLFALVLVGMCGCDPPPPTDEINYIRSDKELRLKITHRNGGSSCSVDLTNVEQAEKYKKRLRKLIEDIEEFEKELSTREKN